MVPMVFLRVGEIKEKNHGTFPNEYVDVLEELLLMQIRIKIIFFNKINVSVHKSRDVQTINTLDWPVGCPI